MSQLTERRLVRNGQTLIGLKITSMRYMSEEERRRLHIEGRSAVIALSDGTLLYPMADDEGNEAGTIMAQLYGGEELRFPVLTG